MASLRVRERGAFWLLVLSVAVISVVQLVWGSGFVRWAGVSVLIPLVAGAVFLSFRRTLIVGALALAAIIGTAGLDDDISVAARSTVISLVALAFGVSLFVCRVRLNREERLKHLMIARERLTLLSEASNRVGSTLDVARTARELAEVGAPRFADVVTVDLFDSVLSGEEPTPDRPPTLRRVAHTSVWEDFAHVLAEPGDAVTYPDTSAPGRCLTTGRTVGSRISADEDIVRLLAVDPRRAARLQGRELRSGLAVPLRARGTTLGVAVFARHRDREPFDDDDRLLAQEVGARAAVCVDNAARFTREFDTSLTLQRSLLPSRLPEQTALEVASRYRPAGSQAGVGGDWFDVIPLSGTRVALVVGDVVGHGLHAAATMGRLRAAVGTLAEIDLPPAELLTHLDEVVARIRAETGRSDDDRHGERVPDDIMATCVYAIYDPLTRHCSLALAGHPRPVLLTPEGGASFVDAPAGTPLGLRGPPFEALDLRLPEGSALALYTDGLVESRHHDIDEGLEKLRRALAGPPAPLEATCDAVLDTLLDGEGADDITLLIARTRPAAAHRVATWDVRHDPAAVTEARAFVARRLAAWGLSRAVPTAQLVVSELVTNAVRFTEGPVRVRLIHGRTLICEVTDGSSMPPQPRLARPYDEDGRGLLVVDTVAERWGTRQTPEGKTVWAEQTTGL